MRELLLGNKKLNIVRINIQTQKDFSVTATGPHVTIRTPLCSILASLRRGEGGSYLEHSIISFKWAINIALVFLHLLLQIWLSQGRSTSYRKTAPLRIHFNTETSNQRLSISSHPLASVNKRPTEVQFNLTSIGCSATIPDFQVRMFSAVPDLCGSVLRLSIISSLYVKRFLA